MTNLLEVELPLPDDVAWVNTSAGLRKVPVIARSSCGLWLLNRDPLNSNYVCLTHAVTGLSLMSDADAEYLRPFLEDLAHAPAFDLRTFEERIGSIRKRVDLVRRNHDLPRGG